MAKNAKSLTKAQQGHLARLNNAMLQAQQRINDFVAYLRDEHSAPSPEWELYDIQQGFVRKPTKE